MLYHGSHSHTNTHTHTHTHTFAGDTVDLSGQDPNTVASLLKLYLRELPEPLIPHNRLIGRVDNLSGREREGERGGERGKGREREREREGEGERERKGRGREGEEGERERGRKGEGEGREIRR